MMGCPGGKINMAAVSAYYVLTCLSTAENTNREPAENSNRDDDLGQR